ncbi:ABC transporter ATP-binding protein [Ottowia sp. GY511]|uniref:ABC transporter ATP-binding protein n=1 Tax=Ottowia flava TaxID=2675430 RepID=A0ABW4KXY0_9BURK|nr:ABC transporter ATP-binding protein [Ottowia sp. GY511]TXK26603.1 ABC transporter ATP-binding protein [Ottowia sp. GY511]
MSIFAAKTIAVRADSSRTTIGNRAVLGALQVALPTARWTAIVGPNGAGKSTLLRVLAGLLPTEGQVELAGRPLADWPARERARQLAWLGQSEAGTEDLRAYDVALLGRLPHRAWLAPASAIDHAATRSALQAMQVWPLRERRLGALSGGERQRVLLARLLAVQAPLWLMDEPLAHLDPPHQADWLAVVRAHVATGGTVVSVLHELGMALQADDLLIVKDGAVVHHGACASPDTHRALQAAFDWRVSIYPVREHWVAVPRMAAAPQSAAHADHSGDPAAARADTP